MSTVLITVFIFYLASQNVLSSTIKRPPNLIQVTCDETVSMGKCTWDNKCSEIGYMCDSHSELCCPVVDYTDEKSIIGPALDGKCQQGFAFVNIPNGEKGGECVNLASIPGICPLEGAFSCEDDGSCSPGTTCFTPAGVCCDDNYSPPVAV